MGVREERERGEREGGEREERGREGGERWRWKQRGERGEREGGEKGGERGEMGGMGGRGGEILTPYLGHAQREGRLEDVTTLLTYLAQSGEGIEEKVVRNTNSILLTSLFILARRFYNYTPFSIILASSTFFFFIRLLLLKSL